MPPPFRRAHARIANTLRQALVGDRDAADVVVGYFRRMDPARAAALGASLRITTPRLVLRRMQPGDLQALLEHEADRRIMRWIRDPEPEPAKLERVRKLIAPYSGAVGEWLAIAVTKPPEDRAIGLLCAKSSRAGDATVEIGYRLEASVHRRGVGFEAVSALVRWLFAEFSARKISATCVPENEASWRLMERLGMVREARLREAVFLDGAWRDEFVYGLLRREWPSDGAGPVGIV